MKKYWKTAGIVAITAGILYYPAVKLYAYWKKKNDAARNNDGGEEEHHIKAFSPAYRGKHKPHHRHQNGHDVN